MARRLEQRPPARTQGWGRRSQLGGEQGTCRSGGLPRLRGAGTRRMGPEEGHGRGCGRRAGPGGVVLPTDTGWGQCPPAAPSTGRKSPLFKETGTRTGLCAGRAGQGSPLLSPLPSVIRSESPPQGHPVPHTPWGALGRGHCAGLPPRPPTPTARALVLQEHRGLHVCRRPGICGVTGTFLFRRRCPTAFSHLSWKPAVPCSLCEDTVALSSVSPVFPVTLKRSSGSCHWPDSHRPAVPPTVG